MKKVILFFISALAALSVFARPATILECRADAEAVVYEMFEEGFRESDFLPIVRTFSSKESQTSVTHFVQVIENGTSSLTTVEMQKGTCRLIRAE